MNAHEVKPSEFRVAVVPEGHWLRERFSDMDVYSVEISWRGKPYNDPECTTDDRWAICFRGRVWTEAEGWVYESSPSSRSPEFCRVARFPLEEAKRYALAEAALVLAELESKHADVLTGPKP